jgi:hypothetical protein
MPLSSTGAVLLLLCCLPCCCCCCCCCCCIERLFIRPCCCCCCSDVLGALPSLLPDSWLPSSDPSSLAHSLSLMLIASTSREG